MAKKDKNTKSSRKHSYMSFRDRVDSIKIDPISDLSKKSFHEVEVSHFLSTLEHWREVNLSKSFQDLVEIVEPLSLSLPLLLHNKDIIFQALDNTLSENDPLSLPPTLELLSQFCHDLGPDFYDDFYERTLIIIRDISQNQSKPESLELIFSTLAYIFKYLSKILSKNLIPTFKILLPLLTLEKKDYINKFTSQAISFLVKKATTKSFKKFVDDALNCEEILESNSESYHNALSIIFSESLKSASGVLHSKSRLTLPLLTKSCLNHPRFTSIFNDIIMELLDYTETPLNAKPLYEIIINEILILLNDKSENENENENNIDLSFDTLTNCTQVLLTLSFGETGKRVSDWTQLVNLIEILQKKSNSIMVDDDDDQLRQYNFVDAMASWCAILIRNCDSSILAKFHIKIFNAMSSIDNGSGFLPFIEIATDLSQSRVLQFSKKFVVSFIANNWKDNYREIAYFLERMSDKKLLSDVESPSTFKIVIPSQFKNFILESFFNIDEIRSKDALLTNYWRILILKNTSVNFNIEPMIKFLNLISNFKIPDLFCHDIFAITIGSLSKQPLQDDQLLKIFEICKIRFDEYVESNIFLNNLHLLISSLSKKSTNSIEFLKSNFEFLIENLVKILKSPSHEARESCLKVIIQLFLKVNDEIPDILLMSLTIEQIPLIMQNARDVPLRFRQLSQSLNELENATPIINLIISNFIFGQLTNKFSPTWQGVTDLLASNIKKLNKLSWELSFEFISKNYKNINELVYFEYDFDSLNALSDISDWLPQDFRLSTNLQNSQLILQRYQQIDQSIIEFADEKHASILPTDFARYQVVKMFSKIPQIPQENFEKLLPFILNEDVEDTSDAENGSILQGWTLADRNGLIECLSVLPKLNKVPGIEKVKDVLLTLLMNKQTNVQQLALKCLLNTKNKIFDKYSKNLNNLLDDTLFRDEIVILMQNSDKSPIESNDAPIIIPLILRILFGRAQTLKTNSTKQGRKTAAIKSLNNFNDEYISEFLKLSFWKFDFNAFIENNAIVPSQINKRLLRNINGFINLNLDVSEVLGKKHQKCLEILIEPLIYALSISEYVIENLDEFKNDEIYEKTARNNRRFGFKLLYQLTTYLNNDFNWSKYGDLIYNNLIESKMEKFSDENAQETSSLMKFMSLFVQKNLMFLLYIDDFKPLKALLSLLGNPHSKDSVLLLVLRFVTDLLAISSNDEIFIDALSIVISNCLETLVLIFDYSTNPEVNSLVVEILLTFVNNDYITNNDVRGILINALNLALEKSNAQIHLNVKAKIVNIMASIVDDYSCSFNEIVPLFKNISKMYFDYDQREMRIEISNVFQSISGKFNDLEKICQLVIGLNSYDEKRIREPDYETRLDSFSVINELEYKNFSSLEWLPVLYTCLYFINDENDQSMRSSASYSIMRFIDALSEKNESDDSLVEFLNELKTLILPALKSGLRKKNELVRIEYIKVLGHSVQNILHFNEFDDMKILLNYDDAEEEANFFECIIHLQTFKRQQAVRKLSDFAPQLKSNSIAHYLLPIVEHYAFWDSEKERLVSQDAIPAVRKLTQFVTWNQFRAIFTRYINLVNNARNKEQKGRLRDSVQLVVSIAAAMRQWSIEKETLPNDYPKIERIDLFVVNDLVPKIHKILSDRNEETILTRVPLSEALISLIMCCSENQINAELPGLLTRISQMLRSRAEDLRDAVRKHLGRISLSLGPSYLKFIIKELKSSLLKGPQIHILSFTIHYLLTVMSNQLEHGCLGESADMIMDTIMNDIFGQASEEKDAHGYSARTKEIKHTKSYDTGELLAANIFLKDFTHLLTPVKYLLKERLSYKTQTKLTDLMRRFAQGLQKNEESSSTDILLLVNEIYEQSTTIVQIEENKKKANAVDEKVSRFLVQLDAKPQRTQMEYSLYIKTLQQFSFELLRTAISKHDNLFNANYLSKFVPYLVENLKSEDEGVNTSALKVLTMISKLEFAEETDKLFFVASEYVLNILQDMPSTDNELCQTCLKFLTAVIKNKPDIELKNSAISYILKKVEPDLDSAHRQSTAFGFLKGLIGKRVMIPEIYDCMETVSRLMVTSTTSEVRQVARSVFYNFLMDYDQSKGKLERQFKLLINNLKYPAEDGRLSVMELMLMIIRKANKDLLSSLGTSFFIALANVSVTDVVPTCRESANEILSVILEKLKNNGSDISFVEKYASAWLSQNKKTLLVRCGLNVYDNYIKSIGFGESELLDNLVFERMKTTFKSAEKKNTDEDENEGESESDNGEKSNVDWQIVYSCMNVLESMCDVADTFETKYEPIWTSVIAMMLYPHSWVRLSASRLISKLLKEIVDNDSEDIDFEISNATIQNIAYRSFRQLGAPDISQTMAFQTTANLVLVSRKWDRDNTPFISQQEEEGQENEETFKSAFDWAMNRCAAILKNDSRDNKDMLVTKKAIVSYCEFLTTFLSDEKLRDALSEKLMIPLIYLSEQEPLAEDDSNPLPDVATNCLERISKKIGVSEYNVLLSNAMKEIQARREERRAKRAQMALNNPQLAAHKKIKKHMKGREKRKAMRDENGYYKPKKRRVM